MATYPRVYFHSLNHVFLYPFMFLNQRPSEEKTKRTYYIQYDVGHAPSSKGQAPQWIDTMVMLWKGIREYPPNPQRTAWPCYTLLKTLSNKTNKTM